MREVPQPESEEQKELLQIEQLVDWHMKDAEVIGFEEEPPTREELAEGFQNRYERFKQYEVENPRFARLVAETQRIVGENFPQYIQGLDLRYLLNPLPHDEYQERRGPSAEGSIAHFATHDKGVHFDIDYFKSRESEGHEEESLSTLVGEFLHAISTHPPIKDPEGNLIISGGVAYDIIAPDDRTESKNDGLNERITDFFAFRALIRAGHPKTPRLDTRTFWFIHRLREIVGGSELERAYFRGESDRMIERINCLDRRERRGKNYRPDRFEELSGLIDQRDFKGVFRVLTE